MNYGAWIRETLARKRRDGLSQRKLAAHMGVHESVVSRIVSGERELTTTELSQICEYLGENPQDRRQITRVEQKVSLLAPVATHTIPVEVVIASGVWRERGSRLIDRTQVPASPDPRLAQLRQYACRIDGPEYGSLAGQYAVCVPYSAMRSAPNEPDTVHVVRHKGDLLEHSLRSVKLNGDAVTLLPYGDSVVDPTDLDASTEITGLVVGFFQPTRY